jgi:hypothetical protein
MMSIDCTHYLGGSGFLTKEMLSQPKEGSLTVRAKLARKHRNKSASWEA